MKGPEPVQDALRRPPRGAEPDREQVMNRTRDFLNGQRWGPPARAGGLQEGLRPVPQDLWREVVEVGAMETASTGRAGFEPDALERPRSVARHRNGLSGPHPDHGRRPRPDRSCRVEDSPERVILKVQGGKTGDDPRAPDLRRVPAAERSPR